MFYYFLHVSKWFDSDFLSMPIANAACFLGPPRGQETGRNEMSHTVCDISLRPVFWPRGGPKNQAAIILYNPFHVFHVFAFTCNRNGTSEEP